MPINSEVLAQRIRRALGALNDDRQPIQELVERASRFIEWLVTERVYEGLDADGGEVQEKLAELGILELRDVDPASNEYEADRLYFFVGQPTPPEMLPKLEEKPPDE